MMAPSPDHSEQLDLLAAEFMARCRQGEQPIIEEYVAAHPALAADIRELFPTILQLETAKSSGGLRSSGGSTRHVGGFDVPDLDRLGDFRILRELGRGGMGVVYEAAQESLDRIVAIKVLPQQFLASDARRERFEREARTAARLHHTNIVPIFGIGEHAGLLYFVMQRIRGVGLDAVFAALRENARAAWSPPETSPDQSGRSSPDRGTAQQALEDDASRGASSTYRATNDRKTTPSGRNDHDIVEIARRLLMQQSSIGVRPPSHTATLTVAAEQRAAAPSSTGDDLCSEAVPRSDTAVAHHQVSDSAAGSRRIGIGSRAYWRRLARLFADVADALAYAHSQHVLHRDIKPGNLLLDEDGTLWLSDFGLAKSLEQEELTQEGDVIGTLRYIAPEQFGGEVTHQSDLYALGITLYEMATLQPAFTANQRSVLMRAILESSPTAPRRLCPVMPRDLETIILKAISREPARRYADAATLRDDLLCFVDDMPIQARRISSFERLARWARRRPALATTTGLSFLLLLAVSLVASTAYFQVRAANRVATDALAGEKDQRAIAEETSNLAVSALDRIFREFAPEDHLEAQAFSTGDDAGDTISVPVPRVLSDSDAKLLNELLAFYRKLAGQEGGSPALLYKAADAYRRMGDIHARMGRYDEAVSTYQTALTRFESLRESLDDLDPPDGSETRASQDAAMLHAANLTIVLGSIENSLGRVMLQQDLGRESHDMLVRATRRLEKLVHDDGARTVARYELANSYYLLSRPPAGVMAMSPGLRRRDGMRPGLGEFDEKGTMGRGREGRRPPGPRFGPRRGRPGLEGRGPHGRHRPLMPPPGRDAPPPGEDLPPELAPPPGDAPPDGGLPFDDAPEGLTRDQRALYLRKAITLLNDLLRVDGDNRHYRHLLARCLRDSELGDHLGSALPGKVARNRAIELLRALVRDYPKLPQYRYDLCETYAVGRAANLPEALAMAQQLVEDYPDSPEYAFLLAHIYFRSSRDITRQRRGAAAQADSQNSAEAEPYLRDAVAVQADLAERFPDVATYALGAANYESALARLLEQQGQREDVPDLLSRATARIADLSADMQSRPHIRAWAAHTFDMLGRVNMKLGRQEEAAQARRMAERYRQPPVNSH